jgi:hypothetical protein
MTGKEILKEWLEQNGYDGFHYENSKCNCYVNCDEFLKYCDNENPKHCEAGWLELVYSESNPNHWYRINPGKKYHSEEERSRTRLTIDMLFLKEKIDKLQRKKNNGY